MTPIHENEFYRDGRGPELRRVHWTSAGASLSAVDYTNPDAGDVRHVLFRHSQVVKITPHEVVDPYKPGDDGRASMFDLGRSDWLLSFAPDHLGHCSHFRVVFYDEVLDVICERISCHPGAYSGEG